MNFIEFIIGALLIFYGSNFLIDNSKIIAKAFNVSPLIIGLTIIAFGTSLPELVVSVMASFRYEKGGEIILGNVIGSNIANIALVLSFIAIIKTIRIDRLKLQLSLYFLIFSTLSAILIIYINQLSYISGILSLFAFIFFMYYQFKNMSSSSNKRESSSRNDRFHYKYIVFLIFGFIMLGIGSKLFIDGAIGIALQLEINIIIISLSMVAFGTSVPELVTSLIAIKKNEPSFVIGNIIGSNIINILLVLGSCIVISPIKPSEMYITEPLIFLFISTFVFITLILFSKSINRFHGFILIGIYVLFIYISFDNISSDSFLKNATNNTLNILHEKF